MLPPPIEPLDAGLRVEPATRARLAAGRAGGKRLPAGPGTWMCERARNRTVYDRAMSDSGDDSSYGTALPDAPVGRVDFERAIRSLHMSDLDLRDALLNLAARVVALTDVVTRRIDGVEPLPAAPGTPAAPPTRSEEHTSELQSLA